MNPQRWQQIDKLFHHALNQAPAQRTAFLDQSCAGDEALRNEVVSLLASYEQADDFIEKPASDVAAELIACHAPKLEIGQSIGHYIILESLGAGGMGEVYLARDKQLQRQIALKLLPAEFMIDDARVRRFEQEARAASALNHPNIVTIHEVGRSNSSHFIATEFVDGETLRQRMNTNRLSLSEALDIATQVASALSAAHEAGIVHRDIKPENIMLRRDGIVKVLDFGIAKLTFQQEPSIDLQASDISMVNTNPGMVMGTAPYISPEQASAHDVDQRTDIWSLGVVLYEMIAGHMPFVGKTPRDVVVSILESQPPSLTDECEVPARLQEIVQKALRKDRDERYQTANELAIDLKSLKQDLELEARLNAASHKASADGAVPRIVEPTVVLDPALRTEIAAARFTSSIEPLALQIRRHKKATAVLTVVLVMAFSTLAYSLYRNRTTLPVAASSEPVDSLAVMPFVNESGDSNSDYLANNITESIIGRLAQLPKLRVISHEAVLRYKSKDAEVQELGRKFKVRAVLFGRIKRSGDGLSISTELVDSRDNTRLWSKQYDRKLSDAFVLQEEIALNISARLRLQLTSEEKKKLEKRYTQNNDAYLLYSSGKYHLSKGTKEGIEKAIEDFEEAIKIDPRYALAYVGLARAYAGQTLSGFALVKDILPKYERAAYKAVELDENLSEAHAALSRVKHLRLDYEGAFRESQRALQLDPNSLDANTRYAIDLAHFRRTDEALVYARRVYELQLDQTGTGSLGLMGYVYFLGRQYDEAIKLYLKDLEGAPNDAGNHFALGEAYVAKGLYKEGIAELQKSVTLKNDPERWNGYPSLAFAYAVSGKREEALKILAEQKRVAKQRPISAYNFAIIYTGLGDKDRAFEYLNKTVDEGRVLLWIVRPMFDSLRSDPRYLDLLERVGRAP